MQPTLPHVPADLDPAAWSSAVTLIEGFLRFRDALADTLLHLPPSYRRSLQAQLTDLAALVNPDTPDCLCTLIEPADRPCIGCAARKTRVEDEATALDTPPVSPRTLAAAETIVRALAPLVGEEDGGAA